MCRALLQALSHFVSTLPSAHNCSVIVALLRQLAAPLLVRHTRRRAQQAPAAPGTRHPRCRRAHGAPWSLRLPAMHCLRRLACFGRSRTAPAPGQAPRLRHPAFKHDVEISCHQCTHMKSLDGASTHVADSPARQRSATRSPGGTSRPCCRAGARAGRRARRRPRRPRASAQAPAAACTAATLFFTLDGARVPRTKTRSAAGGASASMEALAAVPCITSPS